MADHPLHDLSLIDARTLDPPTREILRPGELVEDSDGRARRLPRFFYEVPSWEIANEVQLVEHFSLAELIRVDVREAAPLRDFPRYVPCAVTALAAHLELFRLAAGAPVYIAANGGYRSPGHRLTRAASPHCWGTAANIYRIGDDFLDTQARIERWNAVARQNVPGIWARPYGRGRGSADDHVHLDLGFVVRAPREAAAEEADSR
jgi:hypothetical protein